MQDRDTLTQRIADAARQAGADLVGFGPISRWDNAPAELNPRTIFPQTRSVIGIAVRQQRGALKAVEEGTYWQAYNCDSYWYINEVIAPKVLRAVTMELEEHGLTGVPVHNPFHPHSGRQIREDQPAGPDGMVSLRLIGVATGLGELGRSKVFLTPQYGPRQRVFAVVTDAELTPTPLFDGQVCDDCRACERDCPAEAIGPEREISFTIEGREFSHAPLDNHACAFIHQGRDPHYSPFFNGSEAAGELPSYNDFVKNRFRHLAICVGRGCLRSCLDHLEKAKRIEATFETPLIEHRRWDARD